MKKLLIMIGAAIIAIALIVSVVSFLLSGTPYDEIKSKHSIIYSPNDKEAYVLYDGKVVGSPLECDKYEIKNHSEDNTACLFYTTSDGGKEVKYYVANEDKITALPDNDLEYKTLSADGKKVYAIETTIEDDGTRETTRYFFNVADQTKTEFKYSGDTLDDFIMSKNFDSVIYTSISGEGEEKTTTLYLYNNGENTKLAANMAPVAVSDDAKYIYAYSEEKPDLSDLDSILDLDFNTKYTLYTLTKDGEKTKITDKFDRNSQSFNKDLSQMLFISDDKAYFYANGGERVKIANNAEEISPLLPENVSPIDDFCGTPVIVVNTTSDSSIYRVEAKEEKVEKLASDVSTRFLTNDGETIYFLKNGSLRRINVNSAGSDEILAKDNVRKLFVSKDGSSVYVLDKNDSLYYIADVGDITRIADDVDKVDMTDDGVVIYTDEDDVLYSSKGGDKGVKIADDVCEFSVSINSVIYFADKNSVTGYASAFISKDGKSFANIANAKEFRRTSFED